MTAPAPSVTQEAVFAGIAAWLAQLLPVAPNLIVQGAEDLVPEPGAAPGTSSVVMTLIGQATLARGQATYTPAPNGTETRTRPMDYQVQLDFYGHESGDLAAAAHMLWQEGQGIDLLRQLLPGCSPLWSDPPRMAPLVTGEQAYERRFTMTVHLQVPQGFTLPQGFPSTLTSAIISVEAAYPA